MIFIGLNLVTDRKLDEFEEMRYLNWSEEDALIKLVFRDDSTYTSYFPFAYNDKTVSERFVGYAGALENTDMTDDSLENPFPKDVDIYIRANGMKFDFKRTIVNSAPIIKSAFLEYKGVLNLIFKYAMCNEIITSNPVACIDNQKYLKACEQDTSNPEDHILSEEEIKMVVAKVRKYMTSKRYDGYFINGYAILLSIETGMRVAELCSLKWTDVKESYLHIHSQQLNNKRKGGKVYYYAPWTKNEKGEVKGGRKFPLTDAIKDLLDELKALQKEKGIESEFVFCKRNGERIKTDAYETCLRRLMASLKFTVTNNHTFRKSLNCNVFIGKMQMPVTQRAKLLGHSVATNEKYYSFGGKDSDLDELCEAFNKVAKKQVTPQSHLEVIRFDKEKTLESA